LLLPAPVDSLKVERITVAAPGSGRVLISEVSFEIKAGQALGIIGPSGGGKTTLARALTGIWPTLRGSVRLDNAELTQWTDSNLGQYIGYLPQDVALLDATVEENISRLEPGADPRAIVEAAQITGIHEMIVRMPDGYRTALGPQGTSLSAGQRQRIGLARALYRNPFVVVMDEPNSNLDAEGEMALTQTIKAVRERGGIAVVVAHRPSALTAVDLVAVIQNGKMIAFGPKDEILKSAAPAETGNRPAPAAQHAQRIVARVSE
jgi:ATP-binding cassette subfamily C protein